jgi:hypothetical protein
LCVNRRRIAACTACANGNCVIGASSYAEPRTSTESTRAARATVLTAATTPRNNQVVNADSASRGYPFLRGFENKN